VDRDANCGLGVYRHGLIHHVRRGGICPVTVHQPMDDVHAARIDYLKRAVLTPSVLETVVSAIRNEVAKLLSSGAKDVTGLEKELAGLRAEQKRLARAVATAGDDIPELVAELRLRNDRIRRLKPTWRPPAARPRWWPTSWPAPKSPPAPSWPTSAPPSTPTSPPCVKYSNPSSPRA
jgi:hypothetical protein